jgi:methyltransferase (TIGR00027 family)
MNEGEPSRMALGAAAYRAAHQAADGAAIFADPLARTILGTGADAIIARLAAADPSHRGMRIFIAARSRFAEDCLADAVARGAHQAVILGAGLDTFALRNPHSSRGLRVFEVDSPAVQAWKRKHLTEVGLRVPEWTTFVPVDLEWQELRGSLADAGFRRDRPAFFHWLGVVPYLQRATVTATLRFIADVAGSEVVFDYTEPIESYPENRRAYIAEVAARAAALGEPWITQLAPSEIAAELRAHGLGEQEDLGLADIAARYLGTPLQPSERGPGPHVMRARRRSNP